MKIRFEKVFASLCDPQILGNGVLLNACHYAQGYAASYRANGDRGKANMICGVSVVIIIVHFFEI